MRILLLLVAWNVGAIANSLNPSITYFYSGHLPTPTAWEADLIFNGNYQLFCQNIGASFVSATTTMSHYTGHDESRGGHFYPGWYYVGPRHCLPDLLMWVSWGDYHADNSYTVWKYSGTCGDTNLISGWTFERRALITCA
jgi:hypothetical protein